MFTKRKPLLLAAFSLISLSAGATLAKSQAAPASHRAPELVGSSWLNTPDGRPITLASRRGKVTVVEFWTFACSNCQANLPAYARWQKKFAADGVQLLAVHTPETDYERSPEHVREFLRRGNITYPVLLDAGGQNWNRWGQQFWPAIYLVDKAGRVRYSYTGELQGEEAQVTQRIAALVREGA